MLQASGHTSASTLTSGTSAFDALIQVHYKFPDLPRQPNHDWSTTKSGPMSAFLLTSGTATCNALIPVGMGKVAAAKGCCEGVLPSCSRGISRAVCLNDGAVPGCFVSGLQEIAGIALCIRKSALKQPAPPH